jgi:glycosyltransferase involved in cell wall biosynthesis
MDDAALLEAMMRIVSDERLRTQLSDAGPRRAAMFSWTITARLTLSALRDAAR